MCYNGLSSRATDRVPARPFMFTRHLFGGPRRQAVLLTPPRSTSNSPLFCAFCALLQKSKAHPLYPQSLPASLQKPRVCRHHRFSIPDAFSQPSHPQTCLPRASKGQPANLPTCSYTFTLSVHTICVQEQSPSPFPSTTSPLYTKTPGCHPQRSPRSPLVTRHSPLSANSSTLLHHSEGHPLPFQSLAHSLCVYPGCPPQRSPRSPLVSRHSPLSAFAPARSAGLRWLGMALFAKHGFAGGFQGEGQRFLGDAVDEGADQPAQAGGDVAGERSDFALHVSAAVAFFDSPPGFHAPQVAAVAAGRFLAFAGLTGVFHFRDA